MKGIDWEYQSIDGSMGKAPLAREAAGPNPTDRGKQGSKRHILVDGAGVPLPITLTGANVNDVTRTAAVLDGIVIERPEWKGVLREHLCADKGYYGEPAPEVIVLRGYILGGVPESIPGKTGNGSKI